METPQMDTASSAREQKQSTQKIKNNFKSIEIEVNKTIFKIDFINEIKTLKIFAKYIDA